MVREGRGVQIRLALLLALAVIALAYPALRVWVGQGHELPPTSWASVIVLAFMACGVFFAGLPVRRFLRGQAKKPLNPLRAMRTLVLAQAAALTGALVTGWYLAQVLVLVPVFDIDSRRPLVLRLTGLAAGAILLAIAGLLTQAMCRVDKGVGGDGDDADEQDHHH